MLLGCGVGRRDASIDEEGLACLLYTSDAADERSSVDLGGRRIIKKKKPIYNGQGVAVDNTYSQSVDIDRTATTKTKQTKETRQR